MSWGSLDPCSRLGGCMLQVVAAFLQQVKAESRPLT